MNAKGGKNPFAIDQKSKKSSKVYSTEEKEKLLEGYQEVPRAQWKSLTFGTPIRYLRKDGKFVPGGVVHQNPYAFSGKEGMRLQGSANLPYGTIPTWVIQYDDIQTLYVLPDLFSTISQKNIEKIVEKLNASNKTLVEYCKKLEKRVKRLESKRND